MRLCLHFVNTDQMLVNYWFPINSVLQMNNTAPALQLLTFYRSLLTPAKLYKTTALLDRIQKI